jgi:uncharacterized membrane protein
MTNIITGIIGIVGVCAFLGILLWWTKAVPLIIIVGLVVVLLLIDFVQSLSTGNSNGAKG